MLLWWWLGLVNVSLFLLRKRILARARAFESIRLLIRLWRLVLLDKIFAPLKPSACILRIPGIHRWLAFEARDLGWVIKGSAQLGVRIPLSGVGSGSGGGISWIE
jgi:hypothetical protein